MAKLIKQLRKAAKRARKVAAATTDDEFASGIGNLAEAFRAQADVLKRQKKKKNKRARATN